MSLEIFYFQYRQRDKVVNFKIIFDESKDNYIFDKALFEFIGKQMIILKLKDGILFEPFFPDPRTKIISKREEAAFVVKMFKKDPFSIELNDEKSPYCIEIVSPGILSFCL